MIWSATNRKLSGCLLLLLATAVIQANALGDLHEEEEEEEGAGFRDTRLGGYLRGYSMLVQCQAYRANDCCPTSSRSAIATRDLIRDALACASQILAHIITLDTGIPEACCSLPLIGWLCSSVNGTGRSYRAIEQAPEIDRSPPRFWTAPIRPARPDLDRASWW